MPERVLTKAQAEAIHNAIDTSATVDSLRASINAILGRGGADETIQVSDGTSQIDSHIRRVFHRQVRERTMRE